MIFLPQWLKYKIVFDDKSTSIAEINIFVIFHSLEPLKTKKEIDKFALRPTTTPNCNFPHFKKHCVREGKATTIPSHFSRIPQPLSLFKAMEFKYYNTATLALARQLYSRTTLLCWEGQNMLIVLGVEKKDSHNFLNIFVQKNVICNKRVWSDKKIFSHISFINWISIPCNYAKTKIFPKFSDSRLYYSKELWNAKYNRERQTTFVIHRILEYFLFGK